MFVFAAWIWGGSGNQNTALSVNTKTKKKKAHAEADGQPRRLGRQGRRVRRRLPRDGAPGSRSTKARSRAAGATGSWDRHLWVYVFAPANLRLKLNGRSRVVPGAGTGSRRWLEVTPQRVQLAAAPA